MKYFQGRNAACRILQFDDIQQHNSPFAGRVSLMRSLTNGTKLLSHHRRDHGYVYDIGGFASAR